MKREMIYRTDAMAAVGNIKGLSDTDKSKAMKAVLDVPAVQTCEDAVSRQQAIDALKGLPTWWADEGGYYGGAQPPMVALLDPEDAVSAIENLPSAQPERKKGEWVDDGLDAIGAMGIEYRWQKCSNCGESISKAPMQRFPNFCSNCGADMRGEQDG